MIQNLYKNVHISEYNFCDYTDNKNKYISNFYLIDTEKINRIDVFLKSNLSKQVDVICDDNILKILKYVLPTANFNIVNLSDYIENIRIYD